MYSALFLLSSLTLSVKSALPTQYTPDYHCSLMKQAQCRLAETNRYPRNKCLNRVTQDCNDIAGVEYRADGYVKSINWAGMYTTRESKAFPSEITQLVALEKL